MAIVRGQAWLCHVPHTLHAVATLR
jgi:hypothetical protein